MFRFTVPRPFSGRPLIVCVILALLFSLIMSAQLFAAPADPPEMASGGMLMLKGKGVADEMPAVRLGTDVAVNVSGPVARVTVTQAFRNTGKNWVEASYLYPLPDNGAVDSLKMVVGQRIFVGKIKPREEAKKIYEEALANGQKAGLVEQARANLFRNRVANVGPGETVLVQITFQAPVSRLDGTYSLRLPLVAGPRYIAPRSLFDGSGGIDPAAVRDAENITAPVADPKLGKTLNPVSIAVDLAPGFTPSDIESPYHKITVSKSGANARTVTLASGTTPADRDFELRWRAPGTEPALGLFHEKHNGLDYVMAVITPPSTGPTGPVPPREMVFVIDNSGSMAGESMRAAKDSLIYALGTLRPQDSFNIIRFDHSMTQLFDSSVAATPEQLALARRFAQGLEAGGGTEMLTALRAALSGSTRKAIRQVIFLTDGNLSNESAMMSEIAANGARSRVFMVGMGSAPNTFLMRRMAEVGRGTFTHVGMPKEARTRMQELLDRLAAPVARDLALSVDGANIEFTPADLPDLYAGEPLILLGRTKHLGGTLTITGKIGDQPWQQNISVGKAKESDVVAKLWANRRIAEYEAQRWAGEMEDYLVDAAIEDIGMGFHLVTRRTSLIAVDETPSRPEGARLTREELPLLLPAGWDFEHLFGVQHAVPAETDAAEASREDRAMELPDTATGFASLVMQGLMLLAFALLALAFLRRRELGGTAA